MSSNEPGDVNNQDNELAIEQAKLERAKIELELEKNKQESAEHKANVSTEPTPKDRVLRLITIACIVFLAPVGIFLIWRDKNIPINGKIIGTVIALVFFAFRRGWIYDVPHYFMFIGW